MSLLASAGIYLVLDVNSPLENQNLNRYEPWTSYNEIYLEHIFKVVEQFSYYPNTLLFFAGNEVVNDRRSATVSPIYVKAVIRDLKTYIATHSPRKIPVGYSAADDLHYRISFAKYLECEEDNLSVDFYGVNSYQWCGEQTFQSSGFSTLVEDYHDYTKPIFFSEYGCNEVQPRIFQEVSSLYSKEMTGVFSGGLVYEFSQEPNNYGLVEYQENGDVKVLADFHELRKQFLQTPEPSGYQLSSVFKTLRQKQQPPVCQESYENIAMEQGLPQSAADFFIDKGIHVKHGQFIPLTEQDTRTAFAIIDIDGSIVTKNLVIPTVDIFGEEKEVIPGIFSNGTYNSFYSEFNEEDDSESEQSHQYYEGNNHLDEVDVNHIDIDCVGDID